MRSLSSDTPLMRMTFTSRSWVRMQSEVCTSCGATSTIRWGRAQANARWRHCTKVLISTCGVGSAGSERCTEVGSPIDLVYCLCRKLPAIPPCRHRETVSPVCMPQPTMSKTGQKLGNRPCRLEARTTLPLVYTKLQYIDILLWVMRYFDRDISLHLEHDDSYRIR